MQLLRPLLPLLILLSTMCSTPPENRPIVAVTIAPLRYFVARISKNHIKTFAMVPPGANPATYAPTSQQMRQLAKTKLYLKIGHLPFEKAWMKKIKSSNPAMKVINTSQNINLIKEHGHVDPHIWLSPSAVKKQLQTIYKAIITINPKSQAAYKKNLNQFLKEIDTLTVTAKKRLSTANTKWMLVFHPAWGYLAREFNIKQIAIEEHGKRPGTATIRKLINIAKKHGIKKIYIQKQFAKSIAIAIANEISGKVVQLDPLAENWLQNFRHIVEELSKNGMK